MPPGQPIHKCAVCERYRPCRLFGGEWRCVDHAPAAAGPSGLAATDGGER